VGELLLGFDIGGTKSAVCLGAADGQVHQRHQIPTTNPNDTIGALIAAADELIHSHASSPVAFGVSCGSPLDRAMGLIREPANLPGWVDIPVIQIIGDHFNLPGNLENDADASALAEWQWGLDRKFDDVIYMTCGTGQGAGLILGGRLHRGKDTLAGEIGHVRLEADGPVGCRKAGSIEGLTRGDALVHHLQQVFAGPHDPSSLEQRDLGSLTGRDVGEAAVAGDGCAMAAVQRLGVELGRACAILVDVLNPERISLGSLGIRLGDMLLDPVREVVLAEAHGPSAQRCEIAPAALGMAVQDLAALAAASIARSDID
jgi:glucokinase